MDDGRVTDPQTAHRLLVVRRAASGGMRQWLLDVTAQAAGTAFYFKNGVYNLSGGKSEIHFKNIALWRG